LRGKVMKHFLCWKPLGPGMRSSEFKKKKLRSISAKFLPRMCDKGILKYWVRPVSGFQYCATAQLVLFLCS
jgi:hypothetical protein